LRASKHDISFKDLYAVSE